MKKILRYIFICFSVVLLMSHNSYAVNYTYNVRLYDSTTVAEYQESGNRYYGAITGPAIWGTFTVVFNRSITTYDGLLLDIPFYIWNYQENNSVDGYANLRNVECQGGNINCTVIGQEYSGSGTGQMIHNYIYISSVGSLDRITFSVPSGYNQYSLRLFADERFVVPYIAGFRLLDNNGGATSSDIANLGTSLNNSLGTISNYLNIIMNQTNYLDDILNDIGSTNYKLDQIGNRFDALNLSISTMPQDTADAITETEEEKVQDSADAAEDAANDTTSDNSAATSSLLSTITGVFNAIINADATNCRFDSHLPFMSGNGTIDLCSINPPAIVQGIGSLIALGLFAPFALHMFRRFISITESFQR